MIDLYTWPTPNGIKVHIMLEECGLAYTAHGIDIAAGDQFEPEFLKINPNNKIPAIVDDNGPGGRTYKIFESGAILYYLAEKTGKFFPIDPPHRYQTMQWLMFQMGGVGPMLGQANFFRKYCPENVPYAIDRYTREVHRLYRVMDTHLTECDYLAGVYTIADMAVWPWITPYFQGVDLDEFAHLARWYREVESRPAVQRGFAVLSDRQTPGEEIEMDDAARERLYGRSQTHRG
jgi:GST-like protein